MSICLIDADVQSAMMIQTDIPNCTHPTTVLTCSLIIPSCCSTQALGFTRLWVCYSTVVDEAGATTIDDMMQMQAQRAAVQACVADVACVLLRMAVCCIRICEATASTLAQLPQVSPQKHCMQYGYASLGFDAKV
jgi:hypothetical protein